MLASAMSAVLAALVAALMVPLLFILAESAALGAPIVAEDFRFAYALGVPFALLVCLLLAWPAHALAPRRWSPAVRFMGLVAPCAAVPTALFWPSAGEFPWKGTLAGATTALIWIAARQGWAHLLSLPPSTRSKPSG